MPYQWSAVDDVEPISDSTIEQIGNAALFNVVSGCALTYDAADMTVDLAAGVITHDGDSVVVAGGTAAYTLVSDPSNPRWTWLAVTSAGAATQVNGDPAVAPSVPELGDNVGIALVYVQAGLTVAADATYKIDKRVPAVPTSAWKHIDTQVLGSTAASVSFQSISTDYRQFRITAMALGSQSATFWVRLNNDSGNNYTYQTVDGDATSVTGAVTTGAAQAVLGGALIDGSTYGSFTLTIQKVLAASGAHMLWQAAGAGTTAIELWEGSGYWGNTADLISRIDVLASAGTFAVGGRFVLEGCKTS